MTYTVKIKRLFGWRTIKNVIGDSVLPENNSIRVLIIHDQTRLEIPMKSIIQFSKERYLIILEEAKKESGKTI